jgi:PAS domain S-box-containing protein
LENPHPLSEADSLKLINELEVHQIELEMQNEELLLAKQQAEEATEKYTNLYDFAPTGYFTLSNTSEIIVLNLIGAKMLGKDRSKLIKSRFGFFVSDETKPVFSTFLDRAFKSKVNETCEITLLTEAALLKHVLLSGIVSGEPERCLITMVDITERKKAEEALRESEEHFRTIFDTSPIGMVLVNKQFNFLQVNQSFCDFTGYSAEELSNLTFKDVTHPDYISGDIEAIKQLASGKLKVYQTEKIYIRKDHQQVWGNVHVTPIFDNKGNFMYFLAMIKDANDRKIADAEIQRINNELREANAAKDKFFSIIAHDLKSPFNSILGFSEMLKDDVLNLRIDEIKHYANLIHSSAHQAYLLLENLLEWARMQQGRISFSPRSVILDQLISDEFQVLNNNATLKKISLICDIPKKMIVVADENMLSNIIRNLVSNAIKFTPKEGFIKVSAGAHDGFVHISVSDNGIGIKPEAIEKLFKIETSFTTRGTENEKGTGLGLLLCKEFIEKHGGKIWVESGPDSPPDSYRGKGKGSKFTFTIPDVI